MINYYDLLKDDAAVKAINSRKKGLSSLSANSEALVVATAFRNEPRNLVIVKNNLYAAQQLFRKLTPLLGEDVLIFSVEESLRVEAIASTPTMYAGQMETMADIVLNNAPRVIVTHPTALIRYLPSPETFRRHIIDLEVNQVIRMEQLRELLIESGYRYSARVDQPLTFSMRGDVVDVFSIQEEYPIRIEFFDDEIDSIRFFDLSTQRTIKKTDKVRIVPASTLIYDEDLAPVKEKIYKQFERDKVKTDFPDELKGEIERDMEYLEKHLFEQYLYKYRCFFEDTASILDYISYPDVVLSTADEIRTNVTQTITETTDFITELFSAGRSLAYFSVYMDYYRLIERYNPYSIALYQDLNNPINTAITPAFFPQLPIDKMVNEIYRLSENRKIVLAVGKANRKMLEDELVRRKLLEKIEFMDEIFEEGFCYKEYMVLTARELFGVVIKKGRYSKKFLEAQQLDDYQDLNEGDYVVHNHYGIGKYQGIVTREVRGNHRDYLRILYKDDDELLVPLEQFRLVRKFVGSEGVGIRLNKIGGEAWKKTKEKVQSDVNDIAARLIQLYADREQNIGYAFLPDDEQMKEFEDNFEFELTRDQKKAIAEVKRDMEKPKPMDRLLCGDVGFGKTEVAMIAAFKAVSNLKQVAYLCPTTILSRQHFNTFKARFKGFGVNIEIINRFVLESDQKRILKDVKDGKVDILIGTHRILSNDVKFKDLGLLIVDEEQRFGVEAKEKIKEIKRTIDVLSLSATPIPRTLQLSLIGIMSLSQLDTPPLNRMPIQTYVVEKNQGFIKEVIQRELARGGQVFYLHNNVSTIYQVAAKLEIDLHDARVAVAHGKMSRDEIEDVMYRFVSGEYDILVCTTIIETGIDISNANTVIIEKADNFGLSQLYQIRGRVGRSDRIAYAYLLYDGQRQLSEIASKRLQAIKEFTELGSGYKIAMRDLTIRGAGDLLGAKQAGFINTVGMDMYLDMLQEAIETQKGIVRKNDENTQRITSNVDAYIPEKFAPQDYEKITLYQRIDKIKSRRELAKLQDEIADRYGKLPNSVRLLFEKKRAEILLNSRMFESLDELEKDCRLTMSQSYSQKVDGVKLFEQITKLSTDIKLRYTNNKISFMIPKRKNWISTVNEVMNIVEKAERLKNEA